MTIDREKLISLLVEKTGLDRERVERQLVELIRRIRQAAEAGKSFEIEGFGTFTMRADTLHFEPGDKLETEINNRYAGMKPIELIGAFREPEAGKIPDVAPGPEKDDDIRGIQGKTGAADIEPDIEKEEPAAEREERREPSPIGDAEKAARLMEKKSSGDQPPVGGGTKKEPATAEKSDDPIGKFLVAAVIVLAAGVGGWFAYDLGALDVLHSAATGKTAVTAPQAERQESLPEGDVPETAGENVRGAGELTSGNEVTGNAAEDEYEDADGDGEEAEEEEVAIPSESGTRTYGLYGTAVDDFDGYTIVVHSLRSRREASVIREGLDGEGFRTVMSAATIGGETYYRVGIGQFESVANAQKAVAELPDNFKNNHFIKRI